MPRRGAAAGQARALTRQGWWLTGGLVAGALLVAGGAGWDRHDGVLLDEQAETACASVRTHERARGEAVRKRAMQSAVAAAQASEVDDLRRDAGAGYAAVAAWCTANA